MLRCRFQPISRETDIMKLTSVATMYNSARYIDEFCHRISKVIEGITNDFEIILVDDGSPDESLEIAKKIAAKQAKMCVVELARNHGHHRAMMIGLEQSKGEYVFLTDIDLEEAPENLTHFWQSMSENPDLDLVYGIQDKKETPFVRKVLSRAFYGVFNSLSDIRVPNTELVSRLMTRKFVESLLDYKEKSIFLPAIWTDVGYKRMSISLEKTFNGNSSYTLTKRIVLAVDALTSFSAKPLVFVFYCGVSVSFLASMLIAFLIFDKLFYDSPLLGWTSLIASVLLMGGLILFSLGVIGIYISKIFLEVKSRPNSIVRRVHYFDEPSHD